MYEHNETLVQQYIQQRHINLKNQADKQRLINTVKADKSIDPETRAAIISSITVGILALVGLSG